MKFESTRGNCEKLTFIETVLMGLAPDGGLYLPETFPQVSIETLNSWSKLKFHELAVEVMSLFIGDEIPRSDLAELCKKSYATFTHEEVTPVIKMENEDLPFPMHIMELFHGPTYAFKDVALQFLGNLFEYVLLKQNGRMTVLGATSGDTGGAAIFGLRGKKNIEVFIMLPKGRVSKVQEMQMTTVADPNVHNVAVEGTFDDCQAIVKTLFQDKEFRDKHSLGAINSINFARVLAQVVYYFFSYLKIHPEAAADKKVSFSVPTGNFGDIFAGYIAKMMGLPIDDMVVATNRNDILHRFFSTGKYHSDTVVPSLSPSMDIQISSNFERFLYLLSGKDHGTLRTWMENVASDGKLTIEGDTLKKAQTQMKSASVSDEDTLETIKRYKEGKQDYLLDPHTAIGVKAVEVLAKDQLKDSKTPMIVLSTAHPAKFAEALKQAVGYEAPLPPGLAAVVDHPRRCETSKADASAVRELVERTLEMRSK
eukprot:GFYU01012526.1.p1 GENE.GFYU01012526.1~~GFYU01012526.1.p1  ORF type:complete len:481 (-),score=139.55 GFYU01012526.1:485-1927(-)